MRLMQLIIVLIAIFFNKTDAEPNYYFIRQPSNQTVVAGADDVVIQCHVANYEGLVTWSKDGFSWTFAVTSPYPRYSLMTSDTIGVQNLLISDVTIDDDGFYNCQVLTNDVKLRSRSAYLNVLVPPKSLLISPSFDDVITVMAGKEVSINCVTNQSKPEAKISWRFEGKSIENFAETLHADGKFFSTSSSMRLIPTKSQNGSVVECIASHPATRTPFQTRAMLNVLYSPDPPIIESHATRPVAAGNEIIMTCICTGGNPQATLTWRIGGVIVPSESENQSNRVISRMRRVVGPQDHNKLVTCSANSKAMTNQLSSNEVKLNVLFAPEDVEVTQNPSEGAFQNTSVTLSCSTSQSNPRAILSWFKNGEPMFYSGSNIVIHDDTSGLNARTSLSLSSVTRNDVTDLYTCRAVIPGISFKREVSKHIDVIYPPDTVDVTFFHLPTKLLRNGQTIQIKCIVKGGNPPPNIKWTRNSRTVTTEDDKAVLTGSVSEGCADTDTLCSVLELTLSPSENGARFECTADHPASSVPMRDHVTLQVLFESSSLLLGQHPTVPISGQTLHITCETTSSNPASIITWYHNGAIMSSHKYSETDKRLGMNGGMIVTSSLQFIPTSEDHGTKVTCSALNEALGSSVTRDIIIDIEFAPYFDHDVLRFNATENQPFVGLVPVTANPANVTYRWWRLHPVPRDRSNEARTRLHGDLLLSTESQRWRKILLPSDNRVVWSENAGVLKIRNVLESDAGVYQAKVTNPRGSTIINVTINVFYIPRILKIKGPSMVTEGDDVTMTCSTDSNPSAAKIDWVKEVSNLDRDHYDITNVHGVSTFKIRNVTSVDRGRYRCIATNNVGSSPAKEFILKLKFAAKIDRSLTPRKVARPPSNDKNRVLLPCTAEGDPNVEFEWRDENGTISGTDLKYKIENVTHSANVYACNLYVDLRYVIDDVIKYTCAVSNDLGRDQIEVSLVPRGCPDPPTNMRAVNITYDVIMMSWKPGFNGGTTQTFLLEYKMFTDHDPSTTERWILTNVPSHKITSEIVGLLPNTRYMVRMKSTNDYGDSKFTKIINVHTLDDHAAVSVSGEKSSSNYIVIIATSCGIAVITVLILILYFSRRFSREAACKPKSQGHTTDTETLPTPSSSLTGSDGTSPDKTRMTTSFVRDSAEGCHGNNMDLGTNTVSTRLSGSRQSIERDLSRVGYAVDGISGFSQDFSSSGQNEKHFASSRDTSFSSLMRDDVMQQEGMYSRHGRGRQGRSHWNPEHVKEEIDPLIYHPRRANSVSSEECQLTSRPHKIHLDGQCTFCSHGLNWESPCDSCGRGELDSDLYVRMPTRSSDTMRMHMDRKAENRRIFHSLSMNAGRNINRLEPMTIQTGDINRATSTANYGQVFPPQRVYLPHTNLQEHVTNSNYASEGYPVAFTTRGPDQSFEPPPIPSRDELQQTGSSQFYSADQSSMYMVNVGSEKSINNQPYGNNGLYVLNLDEQNNRSAICPEISHKHPDQALQMTISKDHPDIRNSWVSSSSSCVSNTSHQRHHIQIPSNRSYNSLRGDESVFIRNGKSSSRTSFSSHSSSTHPLIPQATTNVFDSRTVNDRKVAVLPVNLISPEHRPTSRRGLSPPLCFRDDPRSSKIPDEDSNIQRIPALQEIARRTDASTIVQSAPVAVISPNNETRHAVFEDNAGILFV